MSEKKPADQVSRRTAVKASWIGSAVLAPLIAALLLGVVMIPVAHAGLAQTSLLSCTGTQVTTFQPPLTNTPKLTSVHVRTVLDTCVTGGVASGEARSDFQATASCTNLMLPPPPFTVTYEWNTGASSTVMYTASVQELVGGSVVVIDTGTVTSGLDQGAIANETVVLTPPDLLACLGRGVAQVTGQYLLTFS